MITSDMCVRLMVSGSDLSTLHVLARLFPTTSEAGTRRPLSADEGTGKQGGAVTCRSPAAAG